MSSFDEWWEENYMMLSADRTEAEDIYNIGAQSRQAEIDDLNQEITRLKYIVGEKIGNIGVRHRIDAEIHRQFEEQKKSRKKEDFMTDEDIDRLIQKVLKDADENPNKYWHNIYKQVDELQKRINEALDYVFGLYSTCDLDTEKLENILKGNQS